jgi:hypothetical protein
MGGIRRPRGKMVEAPGEDGPHADHNQEKQQDEEKQDFRGGNCSGGPGGKSG